MKKIALLMIGLLLCILPAQLDAGTDYYRTFEVVKITEKSIVLQSSGGKKYEIDRARRPTLKKGDKVRYDYVRNRLGETVTEK